jgi:hypothetical protein
MAESASAELKTLLEELEENLQRMAKTFRQMESGDRDSFVRLGKLARSMQRSVHQFRVHLDPAIVKFKSKDAEDEDAT